LPVYPAAVAAVLDREGLSRSGAGPGDQLRSPDIPVVLDQPGVGASLQDRPDLTVIAQCRGLHTCDRHARTLWSAVGFTAARGGKAPNSSNATACNVLARISPRGRRWRAIRRMRRTRHSGLSSVHCGIDDFGKRMAATVIGGPNDGIRPAPEVRSPVRLVVRLVVRASSAGLVG
jgi:choline dehydrogenase-like flavoprotein